MVKGCDHDASCAVIEIFFYARFKLEDDLAAARNLNHQLRDEEAAAQRLLQQRQDDLQRTSRCDQQAALAFMLTSEPRAAQTSRRS